MNVEYLKDSIRITAIGSIERAYLKQFRSLSGYAESEDNNTAILTISS